MDINNIKTISEEESRRCLPYEEELVVGTVTSLMQLSPRYERWYALTTTAEESKRYYTYNVSQNQHRVDEEAAYPYTKDEKKGVERQFKGNVCSDEERQNSEESKQNAQKSEPRELGQRRSTAEQEKTNKCSADNNSAKVSREDSEEKKDQRGTLWHLDEIPPQSEEEGENTKQRETESSKAGAQNTRETKATDEDMHQRQSLESHKKGHVVNTVKVGDHPPPLENVVRYIPYGIEETDTPPNCADTPPYCPRLPSLDTDIHTTWDHAVYSGWFCTNMGSHGNSECELQYSWDLLAVPRHSVVVSDNQDGRHNSWSSTNLLTDEEKVSHSSEDYSDVMEREVVDENSRECEQPVVEETQLPYGTKEMVTGQPSFHDRR